jgi:hypothetical protein
MTDYPFITDMSHDAIDGLLKLKTFNDSQASLGPFSVSSVGTLEYGSTISSFPQENDCRLPSFSQILLSIDAHGFPLDVSPSSLGLLHNYSSSISLHSASSSQSSRSRRRGRPRKSECGYSKAKQHTDHVSPRPRWNNTERHELIEAIIREKKLDDMSTICWDRIAAAVGRATKACKDQWRREVLPNIRSKFTTSSKRSSRSGNKE